jgi:hypothetical protein
MNPDFFKGTVVEEAAERELTAMDTGVAQRARP